VRKEKDSSGHGIGEGVQLQPGDKVGIKWGRYDRPSMGGKGGSIHWEE